MPEMNAFVIELENKTKALKECQSARNSSSCMDCDKFFECELRHEYVRAAYDKMSGGEDKGFAF